MLVLVVGISPGFKTDGFLSHRLAQPFGRLKIIHPEHLLHTGVGNEG